MVVHVRIKKMRELIDGLVYEWITVYRDDRRERWRIGMQGLCGTLCRVGKGRILCQRLRRLHRALSDLPGNLRKVMSHLLDTFLVFKKKMFRKARILHFPVLWMKSSLSDKLINRCFAPSLKKNSHSAPPASYLKPPFSTSSPPGALLSHPGPPLGVCEQRPGSYLVTLSCPILGKYEWMRRGLSWSFHPRKGEEGSLGFLRKIVQFLAAIRADKEATLGPGPSG